MKSLGSLLLAVLLVGCGSMKTTTEDEVTEKKSISSVSGYTDSVKKTVQVINIDLEKVLKLL